MSASTPLRILHQAYLRNGAWGGMEKSFAGFVEATRDDPSIENYVVENLRAAAPGLQQALRHLSAPAREVRRWYGLPLPRSLRSMHRRTAARAWRVNRVINWNQVGQADAARLAHGVGAAAVYWERGAAWYTDVPTRDTDFAGAYDLYLANSHASRQMLRELWKVRGPVEVCTPALSARVSGAGPRSLRGHRVLRLGFSARLRAFKGGVLAIHAMAALRARGIQARLLVAGDGPDRAAMHEQALRLGLHKDVHFLGWVSSMDGFLGDIDVLLHPALREPYGISCAEALLRGVPVVAARVDGLPEVIADGLDGLCVTPERPLSEFSRYGGDRSDVYPLVFRPERDAVGEPGFVDPDAIAEAVVHITGDADRYEAFSAAGCAAAHGRFDYAAHLRRFTALLASATSASP
ncbi:MAG: glycosyltransferase family 1 protein [Panacagrimonas sp.]|jgi:glycosyltransferase involved in cell wall biosynthesis|nr:glycosyltransferase [Panacagrimonas sp.]MCC2655192.1 glycosyltransferase family 1 protein [Panacagrimonas sp.]